MGSGAHIDFETYSEQDIKKVGTFRYAEDPSTEPLILAYKIGKRPVVGVDLTQEWGMVIRLLSPLFDHIASEGTVKAHNAHFERAVWEKTALCRRFPVTPKGWQWSCTAARARMLAIPGSLDGAAGALGVKLRKDKRGDELIKLFSKPQKKKSRGKTHVWRVFPDDEPEAFEQFIQYCEQDVLVEEELDWILPELSPVEAEAFELDYRINDRGMPVNMERVRTASDFVLEYTEGLVERAVQISGYRPTQREKTMDFLASRGFSVPNLQAATVEKLAKRKGLPDDLHELLDLRIELSRAGTKKLEAIKTTVSPDDRIRGGFLFSAASTRRWSSTGVQMHNLQKPEGETNPQIAMRLLDCDPWLLLDMFDRPLTTLAQSIRGFFECHKGKFMRVADYASVEPRGLAWLAGEEWILKAYRKKDDLYRIMAGKVYHLDHTTISKDSRERFMGKQLVLGCGYGMGPPRFIETVARFGSQIDLKESEKAVYGYRNSVPKITKFWKTLEKSCIRAVKEWKTIRVGKLRFRPETLANGFEILYVDMPSGTIAYPLPSIGQEIWAGYPRDTFEFWTPLGSQWVPTGTFGGSLAENVVQALTRDILRDGLLAADEAGFETIGHVHDEGIAEGVGESVEDLKEFQYLLSNSSEWADGFPIETEGFLTKVYKK